MRNSSNDSGQVVLQRDISHSVGQVEASVSSRAQKRAETT